MPTILIGDVWSAYRDTDLFLIPTTAEVRRGQLQMTHPVALEATRRFPTLAETLGRSVTEITPFEEAYGILVSPRWPAAKLGAFQVQRNRKDNTPLSIIRKSSQRLLAWCRSHRDARVDLPYPGIGLGGLGRTEIDYLLQGLPDQVHLWLPDSIS